MKTKAIFKTMIAMLLLGIMVGRPSVYLQAKAAEDEGVFNFHYEILNPLQKAIYDQLDFYIYEEDPTNGYAVFETESENMTVAEVTEAVMAFCYDDVLSFYTYDIKELEIYDMGTYYPNMFLVKVPVVVYAEEQERFASYLNFIYQIAEHYAENDVYTGIKLLFMTVNELTKVSSGTSVCLMEVGVEAMGVPCVTAYSETGEAVLTYVFLGEWYAIDWKNLEMDEGTGEMEHFLRSRAEISDSVTSDLVYKYPKLADSRYVHTVVEVEYCLEQRELKEGETEEVIPFFHLFFFGAMEHPSPYWNVPDQTGAIIPFTSVMDMYVPLLEFSDYNVGQVSPYHEVIDVVQGYTGAVIARTHDTWYREVYVENMTAYVHNDANIIYGYKYTYVVQE